MTTRLWVKLYLEILDDPKMGRLSNHLWRRAVECFLLAGKQGDDGALPPVEEMAWTLRLSEDKVLEDLHGLAEAGVVHEGDAGQWVVTNFKKRQYSDSMERVKRYRERYSNAACNGGVTGGVSTSSSDSVSDSVSEEGVEVQEEGEPEEVPQTPKEAVEQREIRVFMAATGGRVPGASQYASVIDSVRLLRAREKLDDAALAIHLAPYWLAWSTRKRRDGYLYDPRNITWLTEWALNKSIPPNGKDVSTRQAEHDAEVIREVARDKNGRG